MTIITGMKVMHQNAPEWGAGKVVAVTVTMATIEFSDGKSRKIASSHFGSLEPTDKPCVPLPVEEIVVKPRRNTKASRAK